MHITQTHHFTANCTTYKEPPPTPKEQLTVIHLSTMKCALVLVLALVPLIAAAPAADPEEIIDALIENRHGEHHSRSGCKTVIFTFNLDDDHRHSGHHNGEHGHGGHGGHHNDKEYYIYRPDANHGPEHGHGHGHGNEHGHGHGHGHSSSSSESNEHNHHHHHEIPKRTGGYHDDLEKDAQVEKDANEVM